LLIDPGVTVYASLNPRDYDIASGSCGIVAASSAGCKPLIGVSGVANAASWVEARSMAGVETRGRADLKLVALSAQAKTLGLNQFIRG